MLISMDTIKSIAVVITPLVAVLTFIWAYRKHRNDVELKIFHTYTEKYNSIVKPEKYDEWQKALKSSTEEDWRNQTTTMIKYLNLVWEEKHLVDNNILAKKLWNIWLKGIQEVIATDFAKSVIKTYDTQFDPETFDEIKKLKCSE